MEDQDVNTTSTVLHIVWVLLLPCNTMAREDKRVAAKAAHLCLFTVKRFNNKAQGRRKGGAPWVQRQEVQGTPRGSDNMDGHIPRTMSGMSGVHPVRRMFTPLGLVALRSLQTQGAPRPRRPWALLYNAFGVSKGPAGRLRLLVLSRLQSIPHCKSERPC